MKLEGKYCKDIEIFTDNIEEDAIKQIYEIAGCPEFMGSKIRIMPDVHSGKGIAICEVLGNPDWNYSMCHGCGRIMSRSKAKEIIKIEDYQETMKGIYSTSIGKSTIDEAPQAYKSKDEILEYIKPNCKVKFFMHPVINLKCAEEERLIWKK